MSDSVARVAVFDVDGTLTATNAVDDECFQRAITEVFALELPRVPYANVQHVTDSFICRYLCEQHRGSAPSDAELARSIERFVALLRDAHAAAPARFAPIRGAPGLFDDLRGAGWDVAIATGGWEPSARFKLSVAGIELGDAPLACAGDAISRAEIVRLAIERSAALRQRAAYRVVSIGDRPWDVRTAAEVGVAFVGVGQGNREEALRSAGASVVLPDLADRPLLFDALERATVPAR